MLDTLLAIQPGETLYSWAAANHEAAAQRVAARSAADLLGSAHAMRQHDLPAMLTRVPLVNAQDARSIERTLRNHTVGGFYWPFLSAHSQERLLATIQAGVVPHWRRALCSASRSRPADHPLKLCPACIAVDEQECGRAYWHVDHQPPTTVACTRHRRWLTEVPGRRKMWLMPRNVGALDDRHDEPPAFVQVAAAVGELLLSLTAVDVEGVRVAVKHRLYELGVIASLHSVLHTRLVDWFCSSSVGRWLASSQGLNKFADGSWIAGLLWRRRTSHPVAWVLIWSALDWDSVSEAVRNFKDAAGGRLVMVGGQVQLFGPLLEVAVPTPQRVWDAVQVCDSYAELMQCLGASRSDLIRWLEADPELRRAWRRRLSKAMEKDYLAQIEHSIRSGAATSPTELEAIHFKQVCWLRKHCYEVLSGLIAGMQSRAPRQGRLF